MVYLQDDRRHEGVYCDQIIQGQISSLISQKQTGIRYSQNVRLPQVKPKRTAILMAIRKWMIKKQIDSYLGPKGCKKLSRVRGEEWYHDKLVHEISNPWMRQLRKIRLGVSELLDHTHFIDQNLRVCTQCSSGEKETVPHFLLRCQAYSSIRTKYLKNVAKLGADVSNFKILLGFNEKLKCKSYQKRTLDNREKILQQTLWFIQKSGRFKKT